MQFLDCLKAGVDFMEMSSMLIFHISDYVRAKKFGLPVEGLIVTDTDGVQVGIIEESDMRKYIEDNNIEF